MEAVGDVVEAPEPQADDAASCDLLAAAPQAEVPTEQNGEETPEEEEVPAGGKENTEEADQAEATVGEAAPAPVAPPPPRAGKGQHARKISYQKGVCKGKPGVRKRGRGGAPASRWTPEEETVLTSMLARRLQLPTRWHVRGDLAWALSALPRLGLGG